MELTPVLGILCGVSLLGIVLAAPSHEKVAIVASTLGLLSIFGGIAMLNVEEIRRPFSLGPSRRWFRYSPLIIALATYVLGSVSPPVTAAALALGIALLFILSRMDNLPKPYVALVASILAGSIAYNVFFYYPVNIGIDSWGYLSTASAISKTGHYSNIEQPTAEYYFPFPVVAIAASTLSIVSTSALPQSLLIFPGVLILMQPFLVFLLARQVFADSQIASMSACVVLTESFVTEWIGGPIAQSAALSMLILLLFMLSRPVTKRSDMVAIFTLFLMVVAMHGSTALVGILVVYLLITREKPSHRRMIFTLVVAYLGYLSVSAAIVGITHAGQLSLDQMWRFVLSPFFATGSEMLTSENGLTFIWWGFPASLAILSVFVLRYNRQARFWALLGLVILGLSFAINIAVPSADIDRYAGLAAWFILAVAGGKALRTITGTPRQLILLAPVLFLVCASSVVYPFLSPQYGYGQGTFGGVLPTTTSDRIAIDWLSRHGSSDVFADVYSASYMVFARYQSGTFTAEDINRLRVSNLLRLGPESGTRFFRWTDVSATYTGRPSCLGVALALPHNVTNVVYNNSCDIVEA